MSKVSKYASQPAIRPYLSALAKLSSHPATTPGLYIGDSSPLINCHPREEGMLFHATKHVITKYVASPLSQELTYDERPCQQNPYSGRRIVERPPSIMVGLMNGADLGSTRHRHSSVSSQHHPPPHQDRLCTSCTTVPK